MQKSARGIELSEQSALARPKIRSRSDSGSFLARFHENVHALRYRELARRFQSVQPLVPTREFPYAIPLLKGGRGFLLWSEAPNLRRCFRPSPLEGEGRVG